MKQCKRCFAFTDNEHKTINDCLVTSQEKFQHYLEADRETFRLQQKFRQRDAANEIQRIKQSWMIDIGKEPNETHH